MRVRVITGTLLGIFFFSLMYFQGWYLRVTILLSTWLCMTELYGAFRAKGMDPVQWLTVVYPLTLLGAYMVGKHMRGNESIMMPAMLICAMLALVAIVLRKTPDFPSLSGTLFSLIYPGLMLALLYPMMDLPDPNQATLMLTLSMSIALLGDIGAYMTGIKFGKHKLCPNISPKKTVEGAVGGLLWSMAWTTLAGYVASMFMNIPPLWHFPLLGAVAGACGQCGDLTASIVKRYCGIKDYGSIFPGHGGMLDRLDGVLFNIVVVYVYCNLFM